MKFRILVAAGVFVLSLAPYVSAQQDDDTITVDLVALRIEEAMAMLARATGLNIIVSQEATGPPGRTGIVCPRTT